MSQFDGAIVQMQLALLPFLPAQHLLAALKLAHIPCDLQEEEPSLLTEKQHGLPHCRILVAASDFQKAAAVLKKLSGQDDPEA